MLRPVKEKLLPSVQKKWNMSPISDPKKRQDSLIYSKKLEHYILLSSIKVNPARPVSHLASRLLLGKADSPEDTLRRWME